MLRGALTDGREAARMTGLGSAAATATARGGKYNVLHEGFSKLGAPLTVVLVCFAQGVGTDL